MSDTYKEKRDRLAAVWEHDHTFKVGFDAGYIAGLASTEVLAMRLAIAKADLCDCVHPTNYPCEICKICRAFDAAIGRLD